MSWLREKRKGVWGVILRTVWVIRWTLCLGSARRVVIKSFWAGFRVRILVICVHLFNVILDISRVGRICLPHHCLILHRGPCFGSERGLSQHLRPAHLVEYNQILQNRDLERQRGTRAGKHWTESKQELMAALDVMAKREKKRRVRCYIANCLGHPLDSVSGRRKESRYKVIWCRIQGEDSSNLRTLIQCNLGHISSGKDMLTPSVSDPVPDSVGRANDMPLTENVRVIWGHLAERFLQHHMPMVKGPFRPMPSWKSSRMPSLGPKWRSLWNCCLAVQPLQYRASVWSWSLRLTLPQFHHNPAK